MQNSKFKINAGRFARGGEVEGFLTARSELLLAVAERALAGGRTETGPRANWQSGLAQMWQSQRINISQYMFNVSIFTFSLQRLNHN